MASAATNILNQALDLNASEKIDLVEQLISSLDIPDPAIDAIWAKEADARVEAYKKGEIKSKPADEVFSKYHP